MAYCSRWAMFCWRASMSAPRPRPLEQVFADLTDGPLAHLSSGSFPAKRPCTYEAFHEIIRRASREPRVHIKESE
jgi:hypothetical protein